jgi:hypothetical protein
MATCNCLENPMKTKAVLALTLLSTLSAASTQTEAATAGQSTRVTIGMVERSEAVTLNSNAGKGALVGGTLGLLSAGGKSSSKKARNTIVGAGAGGAIAGVSQGDRSANRYTVRTGTGSSITIVSDQREVRVGDCVAVEESGNTANVRRVAQSACETSAAPAVAQIQPQLQSDAAECAAAKQQLVEATNDQLDTAIRKVKILCDD